MTRSQRRQQRYAELRRRGLSPKQAQKYRDTSDARARRIKPPKSNVAPYKPTHRVAPVQQRAPSDGGRRGRLANFRAWTKDKAFPSEAMDFIHAENKRKHLDPLDSYGYRAFYHYYVDGLDQEDAEAIAEQRNS